MAELTVQEIVIAGLEETFAAAAGGGDTFKNDGRTFFHAKNASVGDITLTFTTPGKIHGVAIADPTVVVTAGEERLVGPFDPSIFNSSAGLVAVGYSGVTTLTVSAVRLP
jgi:hypothetical protein